MGRAKFTVAEKRRHATIMKKAWAARRRAATKPNMRISQAEIAKAIKTIRAMVS